MSLTRVGIERYRRLFEQGRIKVGLSTVDITMAMFDTGNSGQGWKVLYTDASRRENNFMRLLDGGVLGFGIAWKQPLEARLARFGNLGEQEWEWQSSSRSTNVKAEMDMAESEGILLGLQKAEELYQGETPGTIVIYTDNSNPLEIVASPRFNAEGWITNETIYGIICIRVAELVARGFSIELNHVPGHAAVEGNQIADYWSRYEAYIRHSIPLAKSTYDYQGRLAAREMVEARDRRRQELSNMADKAERDEQLQAEIDGQSEQDLEWARFCEEMGE